MKNVILVLASLLTFNANADIVFSNINVPAEISVSYYDNQMPLILPGPTDRRVFIVKAVVEFCRTVSADEFSIQATNLPTGGYVLQLVSASVLMDCFGPTHKQELNYGLPIGVNGDGPFYNAQPIVLEFLGTVH